MIFIFESLPRVQVSVRVTRRVGPPARPAAAGAAPGRGAARWLGCGGGVTRVTLHVRPAGGHAGVRPSRAVSGRVAAPCCPVRSASGPPESGRPAIDRGARRHEPSDPARYTRNNDNRTPQACNQVQLYQPTTPHNKTQTGEAPQAQRTDTGICAQDTSLAPLD